MQDDARTIGLFQGRFDRNGLIYHPGWDRRGNAVSEFDDVCHIQWSPRSRGVALATAADESATGPASFTPLEPDGRPILIDQHMPRPRKSLRLDRAGRGGVRGRRAG